MSKKESGFNKEAVLKWIKFISFIFVILGGLNWLFVGMFDFDIIGGIFGGQESVASRVFYSLFGIGSVVLLTLVLIKVFSNQKENAAASTKTKEAES